MLAQEEARQALAERMKPIYEMAQASLDRMRDYPEMRREGGSN
jgi:hypothetical protein